jgi:hypothetical protein
MGDRMSFLIALAGSDCVVLLTSNRAYGLGRIATHAPRGFDNHDARGPDARPANVVPL